MSFATATSRAASPDLVNRRLVGGLLLSLAFHALLLMLQFGVPGLGLPSPFRPQPVRVSIMPPAPAPADIAAPAVDNLPPLLPAPVASGMRLVEPAPLLPAPLAARPRPATPVKPKRISRPLPPRHPAPSPTRVIAQDHSLNDVVVPQPQPEEAPAGSDDGAGMPAAQVAEARRNEDEGAARAAAAQAERAAQAELAAARADALKAEEQQHRAEQELAQRQQQREQQAVLQRADELAQERLRRQQADQLVAKQKMDELALKQKADALAARLKDEELARRQAAEMARQQAEQAAREQAEQAARQQAEQIAAAGQRDRDRAAAAAAQAGAGGTGATVPKNLLGSDVGNRVRELTRGIDLLSVAPPQRARDDERGARRVVVGSNERDVPLRMYVDSFRQKVERNGGQGYTSQDGDRMRADPLVSVALRSDGSVEDVTIVRSSGSADTDNAVRRIIRLNARYSAFPPNIAAKYDVIEVRRIWRFAETLRLLEELR
jgi:TolA protein